MLLVSDLTVSPKMDIQPGTGRVHPFYRTGYAKLTGVEEALVPTQEDLYPGDNEAMLLPLLKKTKEAFDLPITNFLDIRTTEEYAHPAPEYRLLSGLGLRRISPLGIKGMSGRAFLMGLMILSGSFQPEEATLVCCAELPETGRQACSFIVRKTEVSSDGVLIRVFRDNVSKTEVEAYRRRFSFNEVCYGRERSLVEPFVSLRKLELQQHRFHMLAVWEAEGRYGYVHFQRDAQC